MVSDGAKVTVGTPTVAGAKIAAEVVDQCRGEKVIILKFRRRKRSERRTKGHRQEQTILRVMEISAPGMTTAKAEAKPKKAPKQAATAETDTADAKPAKKAKATGKTAGGAKAKAKAPAKKTAKAKKE